jgi:hypothetical protein
MDKILTDFEIRKSNKQKTEFIQYLTDRIISYGYKPENINIEERFKFIFKTRNIIVGNPDKAKIYITAHYDTCAVSFLPNFMFPTNPLFYILSQLILIFIVCFIAWWFMVPFALFVENPNACIYSFMFALIVMQFQLTHGIKNKHNANDNTSGVLTLLKIMKDLPPNLRNKVCFVFFDNEEKGLFGSIFFAQKHSRSQKKLLINFDCVGDGNSVLTVSKKGAREHKKFDLFNECYEKNIKHRNIEYLKRKAFPLRLPSDQICFEKSIGVATLKKTPLVRYAGRIHTKFDNKCDMKNIDYLSEATIDFIKKGNKCK